MQIDYSGVIVRLVLRIVFIVLFIYLSYLGKCYNKLFHKRRLLNTGHIEVTETAGWFGLGDLFDGLITLRRIPSVRWWMLMVTIGGLSKLSDLATTAVQQRYIQSFCEFGTGMVLSLSGHEEFAFPPFNGRPQFVAGTAQITSQKNGCSKGIYRKVNDDPMFCAAEKDTLGAWNCQSVGDDITYKYGTKTYDAISNDLTNRGLLYPNWWLELFNTTDPYRFSHLFVWSSSTSYNTGKTFDIKASMDVTPGLSDDQVMHSMHCKMEAPGADKIMMQIPAETVTNEWILLAQGYLYNGFNSPPVADPEGTLAWYLNTLIMVAGGSNYLLADAPTDNSTQGCLSLTTVVPNWLIAILGLVVLACVLVSLLAVLAWIQVRRDKRRSQVENAPVDIWTWIAQAVAEGNAKSDGTLPTVVPRDLQQWNVALTEGIVRVENHQGEMQPLSASV